MLKVNADTYKEFIKESWKNKQPYMVYGGPGIGKSEIPRQVFVNISKNLNLEFKEWNHLSRKEKNIIMEKPEKYFVFCDQRICQMDPTDLRGIPNMLNKEMLETIPLDWIVHFINEKSIGCIFFDEINLAPPLVAGQAYQIILNRSIADRKLSDNVIVFGAGNRGEDKAYTFEMSTPLRDRFSEFELTPDLECWTEWAARNDINPHLITFIQWKPTYLYNVNEIKNSAEKASTPRGITRASNYIADKDITSNFVHQLISISSGEAFATEFQAYVKYYLELDWRKILEKPETVSTFSIDKLWCTAGGLAEMFKKSPKDKEFFEKIINVIDNMKPDFAVITLRLMRESYRENFDNFLSKSSKIKTLAKKFNKFLVG